MHTLNCALPSPALRPFVRTYAERVFENEQAIWAPIPARLEQLIHFEFRDPITVLVKDGQFGLNRGRVIGPQTRAAKELLSGTVHSFAMFFQPSGLSKLFGCPMKDLPNNAFDAGAILGRWIEPLRMRLAELPSFLHRVRLVEKTLVRFAGNPRAQDRMLDAADRILAARGSVSIPDTASQHGLSVRQFERRFGAVTGICPKLCMRIARFQSALDEKLAHPERTWLAIAHDLHFHDQMHMIHDFRSLAGASPERVVRQSNGQLAPAMLMRGGVHRFLI
jgi:AraC-like DNA-binding protein